MFKKREKKTCSNLDHVTPVNLVIALMTLAGRHTTFPDLRAPLAVDGEKLRHIPHRVQVFVRTLWERKLKSTNFVRCLEPYNKKVKQDFADEGSETPKTSDLLVL